MTLYVLDSSVAVKWALAEIGAATALAFRDDVRNKFHEIIASDVFPSEVAHALTKAERMKVIPVGDAKKHLLAILTAGPNLQPFIPLLTRAVDIFSAARLAITDCISWLWRKGKAANTSPQTSG